MLGETLNTGAALLPAATYRWPLVVGMLLVAVQLLNVGGWLARHAALVPRVPTPGLAAFHFVHVDWRHLGANLPPLLATLAWFGWNGYDGRILAVLAGIVSAVVWTLGRRPVVGASGFLFALFAYMVVLTTMNFATAGWANLAVAAAVCVLWLGGMLVGSLPWVNGPRISWFTHAVGLATGSLVALSGVWAAPLA